MELTQLDVELYGPMGGPREYSESEGRFNGGGFIDGPFAASDYDGRGTWAPAPARDPEGMSAEPSMGMGAYGSSPILDTVENFAGMDRWFG